MDEYLALKDLMAAFRELNAGSETCVASDADAVDYDSEWCVFYRDLAMPYFRGLLEGVASKPLCHHEVFDFACAQVGLDTTLPDVDTVSEKYTQTMQLADEYVRVVDEAVDCVTGGSDLYDSGFCRYFRERSQGALRVWFESFNNPANPVHCPLCASRGYEFTPWPADGRLRTVSG